MMPTAIQDVSRLNRGIAFDIAADVQSEREYCAVVLE